MTLSAVLDANVLYPASLRDILLHAGEHDLYRMFWTPEILAEVQRNLVKNGETTEEKAQKLIMTLLRVFPRAIVTESYETLIDTMPNDPKDRHVLAAAVAAKVDIIVTANLRDFPADQLANYHVLAQHPDVFLSNLFAQFPSKLIDILHDIEQSLRHPILTGDEILAHLHRFAPHFVGLVRAQTQQHP